MDAVQQLQQRRPAALVQPRRRLVEHQIIRRAGQHRSDRHAPLFAAGEAERIAVEIGIVKLHRAHRLRRQLADPGFRYAPVARRESQFLAHRFLEKLLLGILKDQPHLAADLAKVRFFPLFLRQDRHAVHRHRPRRGTQDRVQMLSQRRLAAACMPDERRPMAAFDRQRNALQSCRLEGSVFMVNMAQIFDDDRHKAVPIPSAEGGVSLVMRPAATSRSRRITMGGASSPQRAPMSFRRKSWAGVPSQSKRP